MGINCPFFFQAHWRDPWRPKGIVQNNLGNISEDAHRHGCWSRSFHWSESILQCFLCGTYFGQTNQHAHLWLEKGDILKLMWSFNFWIKEYSWLMLYLHAKANKFCQNNNQSQCCMLWLAYIFSMQKYHQNSLTSIWQQHGRKCECGAFDLACEISSMTLWLNHSLCHNKSVKNYSKHCCII